MLGMRGGRVGSVIVGVGCCTWRVGGGGRQRESMCYHGTGVCLFAGGAGDDRAPEEEVSDGDGPCTAPGV